MTMLITNISTNLMEVVYWAIHIGSVIPLYFSASVCSGMNSIIPTCFGFCGSKSLIVAYVIWLLKRECISWEVNPGSYFNYCLWLLRHLLYQPTGLMAPSNSIEESSESSGQTVLRSDTSISSWYPV